MFGVDDAVAASIIGAAGNVAGGAASTIGQLSANATQVALAKKQMDFQERMSDTMYRRGTADMKAAGLNPILAAGNVGTSSPGGAMAQVQNPLTGIGEGVEGATSTAVGVMSQVAQLAKVHADVQKVAADTEGSRLDNFIKSFGAWMDGVSSIKDQETDPKSPYNATVLNGGKLFVPLAVQLMLKQAGQLSSASDLNRANTALAKVALPAAGVAGSRAAGYLTQALRGIGGARALRNLFTGMPDFGQGGPSLPGYVSNSP